MCSKWWLWSFRGSVGVSKSRSSSSVGGRRGDSTIEDS